MKTTGLRAKDLKALAKSQPKSKNRHRSRSSASQNHASASAVTANPQFAAAQFMGLPLVSSMPMGVGMPAGMLGPGAMGMLPHFSQVGMFCNRRFSNKNSVLLCGGKQLVPKSTGCCQFRIFHKADIVEKNYLYRTVLL